jgi:hypothetical protein
MQAQYMLRRHHHHQWMNSPVLESRVIHQHPQWEVHQEDPRVDKRDDLRFRWNCVVVWT